jgi:signal peptidase I
MTRMSSIPCSAPQPTGAPASIPGSLFSFRLVLAALLSAVVPGFGHILVKRWKRGCALLFLAILILVLDWNLRPALRQWGLGLITLSTLALNVYSAWDIGYSSRIPQQRLSQWWLVFLLPGALAGTSAQTNLGLLLAGTCPYNMASESMKPAIPPRSNVMVDLHYYRRHAPERGDLIVFSQPRERGPFLIKRVIAVGGQTIEIDNDRVFVDDYPLDEPYLFIDRHYPDPKPHFQEKVPPGKLFVLGDNRRLSFDSRFSQFGFVDERWVRGKVMYVMPTFRKRLKLTDIRQ